MPEREVGTRTDFGGDAGATLDIPVAGSATALAPATPAAKDVVPGNKASRAATDASIGRLAADPRIDHVAVSGAMASIAATGAIDEVSDADALMHAGLGAVPADPIPGDPLPGEGENDIAAENLPAVMRPGLVGRDPEFRSVLQEPEWRSVKHLPGYMQQSMRAMARAVFRRFDSFARHEEICRAEGRDPLAEIQVVAEINGAGPNRKSDLDMVAGWIRRNGVVQDRATLEFPGLIDGYRPDVILAHSENETFLLVQDSRQRGAPVDGRYVYRWTGGMGFRLEAPASAALPRQAAPVALPAPAKRASHTAFSPAAAAEGEARTALLRANGFLPCGTPEGPGLRKRLDDGTTALVLGEPGKSLRASILLRLRIEEPGSPPGGERTLASAEEILEALEGPGASFAP
jgi:hypothetical protein